MERELARSQPFAALRVDALVPAGNTLALLGASLCQPYAGATTAVLVDELDAGQLERPLNGLKSCSPWLACTGVLSENSMRPELA